MTNHIRNNELSAEEKYKRRLQRKKEDMKIAEANEERGIVILITGNGKGKSTSGFGTMLRCVGHD